MIPGYTRRGEPGLRLKGWGCLSVPKDSKSVLNAPGHRGGVSWGLGSVAWEGHEVRSGDESGFLQTGLRSGGWLGGERPGLPGIPGLGEGALAPRTPAPVLFK